MYEVNERVLELREKLKLTRKEFGEKIGVSDSVIKNIDYKKNDPRPLLLTQICTVYNVNESWLLNGEGEMFVKKTLEDELIDVFGKILNDDNDFRKRMISALAQLDDDGWNAIEEFCKRIVSGGEPKEQSE